MELNQDDYFLGVWYACDKDDNNFLAIVKRSPQKNWELEYRFRYVKDTKIFDSNDEKSFYRAEINTEVSEEDLISKISSMLKFLSSRYSEDITFVEVKGNLEKFMFKMAQQPWCHIKEENLK